METQILRSLLVSITELFFGSKTQNHPYRINQTYTGDKFYISALAQIALFMDPTTIFGYTVQIISDSADFPGLTS